MSLVKLIAQADERGLVASGLACLDRCVPLLGGDDEVLRPLWASLTEDADTAADGWSVSLAQARVRLTGTPEGEDDAEDEAVLLARSMLAHAPADRTTADAVRTWADACSVASLRIHRLLDPADDEDSVDARRQGRTEGMSPLVAAELRRQAAVLELLAGHGGAGLRPALEVCTEGRRVLRAVVSRRARVRG